MINYRHCVHEHLKIFLIYSFLLILKGAYDQHKAKIPWYFIIINHIFEVDLKIVFEVLSNVNPHLYRGKMEEQYILVSGKDFTKISQFTCSQVKMQLAGL